MKTIETIEKTSLNFINKHFLILLITILIFSIGVYVFKPYLNAITNGDDAKHYLNTLVDHKNEAIFPFRYLYGDDEDNILPIVLVSAFFRDEHSKNLFTEYTDNGVKIVGITAYKTFPKPITDSSADNDTNNDTFEYTKNIQNWLCCFKEPTQYGFTYNNNLINISESDFYDVDDSPSVTKKYDIVYVCLKDDANEKGCNSNSWNEINRNYDLALKCLPILINEYKLKVLVIGKSGCGLEEKYGNMIETTEMLPWEDFQNKLRESRILFIPNVYDASPRVVTESITKGLPVLMNRNIVCGSKYINAETGELFTDDHDIRYALDQLLSRMDTISPKTWWKSNYGVKKSATKFRNFLYQFYPEVLVNVNGVHFFK